MSNSKNCRIYVVRHGETDWNVNGLVQGHTDIPLNEQGAAQAGELAEKLKSVKFDAAFSSDLLRAKRTAEIISLERQLVVKTTEALREQFFGEYEGKKSEELRSVFQQYDHLLDEERFKLKVGTMETGEEVVSRFILFLREVAVAYIGKTVLMVCHGAIMRHLLVHLGFATYTTLPGRNIKNLASVVLESDGIEFFVKETKGVLKIENT